MPFEVLATSRSFCAAPGRHHDYLRSHGCRVTLAAAAEPYGAEALRARIGGYDGVILGLDAFDASVAATAAPRLRVASRVGTGLDTVDLDAATRHGIVVTHTPGANARAVAELTIASMLALARSIPQASRALAAGEVHRPVGMELAGKTLGLVGFGAVGRRVAAIAHALGMRVQVYDPYVAEVPPPYASSAWPHLLAGSDVVSLHAALTPETRGLLGADALERVAPGALLVNTARPELVDTAALLAALRAGRLGGAAVDEGLHGTEAGRELMRRDDVIATPHLGARTHEAVARMSMMAAENLVAVLTGTPCRHAANPEAQEEAP